MKRAENKMFDNKFQENKNVPKLSLIHISLLCNLCFCTSGNHSRPCFPHLRSFSRLPLLPLLSFVFLYRQTLSPSCKYSSHLPLPLSSCFSSPFSLSQIMPRHPFAMLSSINAITGFSPYSPLFWLTLFSNAVSPVDLYAVSYTHLDVYKRQVMESDKK